MQEGKVIDTMTARLHEIRLDQNADRLWVDGEEVKRTRALEDDEDTLDEIGIYGLDAKTGTGAMRLFHFRMADLRSLPEHE